MQHEAEQPMGLSLNDNEAMILQEALQELRRVKMTALATVNVEIGSNPRVRHFTKEDFGITVIDALAARIGEMQ
jgi:hypothetical protein